MATTEPRRGQGVSDQDVIDRLDLWTERLAGAAARQSPVLFVPETWCRWLRPEIHAWRLSESPEKLSGWLELS
jgi:hypothetical protein